MALGLDFVAPGGAYASFLWEARRAGATRVLLVVRWQQSDVRSSVPQAVLGVSAPLKEVRAVALEARRLGFEEVAVMPIVTLVELRPGEWRGTLRPPSVDAWFDAYTALLDALVEAATDGGVDGVVIGSELSAFEPRGDLWSRLAARVRSRHAGWIAYAANWDHVHGPVFWSALDTVGVSGYWEPGPGEATSESWRGRWEEIAMELRGHAAQHGRPVSLVEYGYRSDASAWLHPWNHGLSGGVDLHGQAALLDIALGALSGLEVVERAYLWNWFGHGGSADDTYTPRSKPAADVFRRHCSVRRR